MRQEQPRRRRAAAGSRGRLATRGAWWLLLALALLLPAAAQDDGADLPSVAPPAADDGGDSGDGSTAAPDEAPAEDGGADPGTSPGPGAHLPERAAQITKLTARTLDDDGVVRVTLTMTWPKRAVESRFEGQATFVVTVPNARPAAKLPTKIKVAKQAVAEVVLTPQGLDTQVLVRLNTPVRCRAYAMPSQSQVIIECAVPPPAEERPQPGGRREHDDKITAQFVDTDIRVIIDALVSQTGANIMIQPGVSGTYSLDLRDVTLTEALDALWEAWNLVWMQLPGNIYLVGTESDLGERRVDETLGVPEGWKVADLWKVVSAQFGDLRLAAELSTVPEAGPLPVAGPLKSVGRARRWVAALPPQPEGQPVVLPLPATTETQTYSLKHLTVPEAEELVVSRFPQVSTTSDGEVGTITLNGPRVEVLKARRMLSELDVAPPKEIEEGLWLPLIPPEKIANLAKTSGVQMEVVYTDDDGSLVYLRGQEDKVQGLRELVKQLQDAATRRKEKQAADQESDRATVSRTYHPATLSDAEASRVIAATGVAVSHTVTAGAIVLTGRSDRVAQVLAALSTADQPLVYQVYPVRYARTPDLARLVRGAVPDLKGVEHLSHRQPGETERTPTPAVEPPPAAKPAAEKPQLGPAPAGAAREEPLGLSPRLILVGSQPAVDRALAFLAKIDVPPAEIELSALVAEVSPWIAERLGVAWNQAGAAQPRSMVRDGLDLAQAEALIAGDSHSKLLARPVLRTLDGAMARLLIGHRVGFQTVAVVDGVQVPARDVERVGVVLDLTPSAPGDGTIVCRVHPEVSEPVGAPAATAVATREIDSLVRVTDGGVIVVAGLLDPALPTTPTAPRREVVVLIGVSVLPPR